MREWREVDHEYVTQHICTFVGGDVNILIDKETGDAEVSLSVDKDEFQLDFYEYYPSARDREEIVEEVLGVIRGIKI